MFFFLINLHQQYSVTLGQPSGGSTLNDVIECHVTVSHDVMCGKVEFDKNVVKVVQTDGEISIPIKRSFYTEGNLLLKI